MRNGQWVLAVWAVAAGICSAGLSDAESPLYSGAALAAGFQPLRVCEGDMDGDGNEDLVLSESNGRIRIFLNRGLGQFEPLEVYDTNGGADGLRLGDVDADGDLDILCFHYRSGIVVIARNNGVGVVEGTSLIDTSEEIDAEALFDFDSDGDLDILVCDERGMLRIFSNSGAGDFILSDAIELGIGSVSDLKIADFDRDGDVDVVFATRSTVGVAVLLNEGQGGVRVVPNNGGVGARFVAVSDLDGDGNLDIVASNPLEGTISLFYGQGDGLFLPEESFVAESEPGRIASADFNDDGFEDLVVFEPEDATFRIYLGQPDGSFAPQSPYVFPFGSRALSSAVISDQDVDGDLDLVLASIEQSFAVQLLNNGCGEFIAPTQIAMGRNTDSVVVGDLDGDGDLDVVSTDSFNDDVHVVINQGNRAFAETVRYNSGATPIDVALGDVDADGRPDLVVGHRNGPGIAVMRGLGGGSFAEAILVPGAARRQVELSDVDLDGDLDIVGADGSSDAVGIYSNDGSGNFALVGEYLLDSRPFRMAVGDMTGDGLSDIALSAPFANAVFVMTNQGGGVFDSAEVVLDIAGPDEIVIEDVDGDGFQDLIVLVEGKSTKEVCVLLNRSGNGFREPNRYPAPVSGVEFMSIGDANGDGSPDLLVTGSHRGVATLLRNDGAGAFTDISFWATGSHGNASALADFDADGCEDLAIGQGGGGNMYVHFAECGMTSCAADLVPPIGVVDAADAWEAVSLFLSADSTLDLAAPFGTLNIFDIQAYIALYNQGCP